MLHRKCKYCGKEWFCNDCATDGSSKDVDCQCYFCFVNPESIDDIERIRSLINMEIWNCFCLETKEQLIKEFIVRNL
jgi:hypothetical protein